MCVCFRGLCSPLGGSPWAPAFASPGPRPSAGPSCTPSFIGHATRVVAAAASSTAVSAGRDLGVPIRSPAARSRRRARLSRDPRCLLTASLHRSPSHLVAPPSPVRPPPVVTRRPPPVSAWLCFRASSGPGRAGVGWRARLRAPSPPELAVGGAGVRRSVHLAPPVLGLYRAGAVAVRGGLAGRIVVSMVSASEWPVG